MKSRNAKNFKIVEQEDYYGTAKSEEDVDELNFEESDEDLPVVVNEAEFLKQLKNEEKEKSKSPSPPRRTINEMADEDDIVYRDKFGKRITRDQWLLLNHREKRGREEPKQELVWGKGLVQIKEKEEILKEEQKIINQSFQNFDIDQDYDEELKEKKRWSDPINTNSNQQSEEPRCRFSMVPNRFNIEPGYRWDGVIRGNNYEQRWFEARAVDMAKDKQAYLNNISDL
eukprot:XP_765449.1 hypothetical protein [Theileria parva strain Muguga]